MILKALEVSSWRCYLTPVRLEDFSAAINLVHGPNGTGKSTLIEALGRGLFDRHSTSGQEMERLRPWGRALRPVVVIEFEHRGICYRTEKAFLDRPDHRLLRLENGRWNPLAEGDAADRRVRDLLRYESPGRGASKPEHWGLAQLLWTSQGQPMLPQSLNQTTEQSIRSSLGLAVATPTQNRIEAEIDRRYQEVLREGGNPRKQGPLDSARNEHQAEQEKLQAVTLSLSQLEQLEREVEDTELSLNAQRGDLERLVRDLAVLEEQAQHIDNRQRQFEAAEKDRQQIADRCERLTEQVETLRELRTREQQVRDRNQELEERLRPVQERLEQATDLLQAARRGEEEATSALRSAQQALELAETRRELVTVTDALRNCEEKLEKATELEKQVKALREQLRDLNAPEEGELKRLRQLGAQLLDARTRLDAAQVLVTFTTQKEIEVTVACDASSESCSLQPGQEGEWRASRRIELVVGEVGALRVRAGAGAEEAADLESAVDKVRRQFEKACAPFGTTDVEVLSERTAEAQRLRSQIEIAVQQRDQLAPEGIEPLAAERTRLIAQCDRLRSILPDSAGWEPDQAAVDTAFHESRNAVKAAEKALEEARAQVAAHQQEVEGATKRRDKARDDLVKGQGTLAGIEGQIVQLTSDGLSDRAREEALAKMNSQRLEAERRVESLRLTEEDQRSLRERDRARREVEALDGRVREAEKQLERKKGELRATAGEGLYTAQAQAEERCYDLQRRLGAETRRAEALRLLRRLVTEKRRESIERVLTPVSDQVTRDLQFLAGAQFERVEFGESALPTRMRIADATSAITASLEDLSWGTGEQLYLLVRLSLGRLIARGQGERQLMVLDDPLVHTDHSRRRRMLDLLEEAAESLQILILCHRPEDYAGLSAARQFDLVALREACHG